MARKAQQLSLFKENHVLSHGGLLRKKASGRGARPLSSKESIHLVLRSSLAKGEWSMRNSKKIAKVTAFLRDFSKKKGVLLVRAANVGNHLHLQIRIPNRIVYVGWVRGLTSGLAMILAGKAGLKGLIRGFWDYRPFTRVIRGLRALLNMRDYIEINQLEASGAPRVAAMYYIKGANVFAESG